MDVLSLLLMLIITVEIIGCLQINNAEVDLLYWKNSTENTKQVDYRMKISKNCSVSPVSDFVRHDIKQKLDSGAKLIYIKLNFINHTGTLPGEMESDIYKPFHWERTTGRHGQGLLFLKTGFEIFSLSTLTFGTDTMEIELQEDPIGCLLQRNVKEIEINIKRILLNDFQEISPDGSGGSLNGNENVCNMHIKNVYGRAVYYHVCCYKTMHDDIECEELIQDIWVQILFYCIYLMNFIAIMFCPYLIPKSLYNIKYKTTVYNVSFTERTQKGRIQILKQSNPQNTDYLDINKLLTMKKFKERVTDMRENVPNLLIISELWLRVRPHRLIPPNDVPVGILESLYNSIFRCKIRETESCSKCCESSMCGPLVNLCPNSKEKTWHCCLKLLMSFVKFLLIITPWIIRIIIFYEFENAEFETKEKEAQKRNLEPHYAYFPGSLVSFLSPFHILFIVCYVVEGIALMLYKTLGFSRNIEGKGLIMWEIEQNIETIVRKCFSDMNEYSFKDAFGWTTQILLYPFEKYGILAFLFFGIYWAVLIPVCIIVLCFYCFPTLNIFLRLIFHLLLILFPKTRLPKCLLRRNNTFWRNQEIACLPPHSTRCFHFFQFITVLLCLLAMISSVILAVELFVFFLEIIVYTLIGIILNASQTLKFVSLFFMLFLYARDCFGGVSKKYQLFNQAINKALLEKARNEVNAIAWQSADEQQNTAFEIKVDDHGSDETCIGQEYFVSDGILKTKIDRVLLFLDNEDRSLISRDFFFKVAYMKHKGCPGSLFKNLCQALRQFCIIILFLLFVMVVVMAFGNEYSISGFNQMLATLAGGFLPWIFRNILFKPPNELELDISSVSFSNLLNEIIRNYREIWPVADIDFVEEQNYEDARNEHSHDVRNESDGEIINEEDPTSNESSHDVRTHSNGEIIIKTYEQEHWSNEIEML